MSGVQVPGIFPDPVDTGYEAQILDGPGFKEGVPGIHTLLRPTGYIKDEIVFRRPVHHAVTGENREAEVIANLEKDPEAGMLHDDPFIAGFVLMMLSGKGKQMMLVVKPEAAIREYEIEAVTVSFPRQDGNAAGNRAAPVGGKFLHPAEAFAVLIFCHPFRFRYETGRKHLREDNQVGLPGTQKHPAGVFTAFGRIPPLWRRL